MTQQPLVLVTGAGGYIGTTLVPMLLERSYRVRAADRFFFGQELVAEHDQLEMIRDDSRRFPPALFEGVDYVIDLVALSNDPTGELFQQATWDINHKSRTRTATLAKEAGATRYVLPSSCSIYGWQEEGVIADESTKTNPLTTYAKANESVERDVLALADDSYCVTVLRQATVYGFSPRMRFDIAINGMTLGAWQTGKLPLMRDGTQWRPMIHVRDTAKAMCLMLEAEKGRINGEIFNVSSEENNYQLQQLSAVVAQEVPRDVEIVWYGDPDRRSYRVSSAKIEGLGYHVDHRAEDGVREICTALDSGRTERTARTITLEWYQELHKWHRIIKAVEMYGGIVEI